MPCSRTEVPFLYRHYPASLVLPTSPPPCRPNLTLVGCWLARATQPAGLLVLRPIPLPYMPPPIPRGTGRCSGRTQNRTLRVAHLERGGINLDFAVEDEVLPSAEPTHEGDLVGETQSIVMAPPQGDLAPIGFEKAGIANQTGTRDVGVEDRQGSVRNKRSL